MALHDSNNPIFILVLPHLIESNSSSSLYLRIRAYHRWETGNVGSSFHNQLINANMMKIIFPNLHYSSCAIISKKKSFKNWYLENWKAFFKYQNVSIFPSDNGLFTSITQKYQALKSQCHPHMARIMGHKNEKFTFYFTFNFTNCNILNSKPCQNCGYSLRKQ